MDSIYDNGKYLEVTRTWHAEDSPWKAAQIGKLIIDNQIHPTTIVEVGCGAGAVLDELSKMKYLCDVQFVGYDISPQAIELAKAREGVKVKFYCEDFFSQGHAGRFDVLLVVDVFEHVQDYMGFLRKCRTKAEYKIYHIPLDIHVSSVLRNAFLRTRYTLGHLHYFTSDSAIATLKDTGHNILAFSYTNGAIELFKEHPSFKKMIGNVPRFLFSKFSVPLSARLFGGYSLLVLTR
jgi:SAM-dependent methyltransferase